MRLRFFGQELGSDLSPTDRSYVAGDIIAGCFLVLDRFEGGLGIVYLVDDGTGPFVLKAVKAQLKQSARDTFAREARAWIQVGRHPNIVPAFWVNEVAGEVMVAAEYIKPDANGCTSLRDILSFGPLNFSRTISFAADFCFGMQHALSRGVVAHRDIKPENLLVGASGVLQITDFGLALGRLEVTAELKDQIAGTPSYMAPEQWRGEDQSMSADLYSFGMVLYEMCFGGQPWKVRSVSELRDQHLHARPTIPSHPLAEVIDVCLRKDSRDRPQHPNDLFSLIEQIARAQNTSLPTRPEGIDDEQAELMAVASLGAAGDGERARSAAVELTRRWPRYAPGWTQLGRIHLERGDLHSADRAIRQSLQTDPTRSPAWNNLGVMFSRACQWEAAVTALEVALDIDPQNTGAMLNLANPLTGLRRYDEAAALLLRASAIAPDKFSVWVNLGSAYKMMGRKNDALTALRKGLELAPLDLRAKITEFINDVIAGR